MATEIERKFLVKDDGWRSHQTMAMELAQGYLAVSEGISVRVRISDEHAWLTVKGPQNGIARSEFEYVIPANDADALLGLCGNRVVRKTRHKIPWTGHVWEIDEFHGANQGLVLAEIELTADDEKFEKPPWIGAEVSDDPRYRNANLSERPYATWSQSS